MVYDVEEQRTFDWKKLEIGPIGFQTNSQQFFIITSGEARLADDHL